MRIFGGLLAALGVIGAWNGPGDPEYVEDWGAFLFAVTLIIIGVWLLSGE